MQCYAQRKNDILSARYPKLPDESYNDVVARARFFGRNPSKLESAAARRAAGRAASTRDDAAA